MMGTLVGITLRGDSPARLDKVAVDVFGEIERLEGMLSEWRPDSAVSSVNRAAGRHPVPIPTELAEVAQIATEVARATDGAFDCTWAALEDQWRFETAGFRVPSSDAVAAARACVDYRELVLDRETGTLFLGRPGMRIGLGGVAKAYIAERAAQVAVAEGVDDVLVDAGGDLVARGRNGDRPWMAGIRDARSAGRLLATIQLRDQAIATSGDYEHFLDVDGHRYHHLLDPRTGYPATHSRSATVVAPSGALADALATALFVLGPAGLPAVLRGGATDAFVVAADGVVHSSHEAWDTRAPSSLEADL